MKKRIVMILTMTRIRKEIELKRIARVARSAPTIKRPRYQRKLWPLTIYSSASQETGLNASVMVLL